MITLPATSAEIIAAIALVTVGSVVQGSIGFGMGGLAAPLLLLVNPVFVPGPLLFAGILILVLTTYQNRGAVIARDVALGTIGRLISVVPAVYVIGALSSREYDLLFAGLVILAVVLSTSGWAAAPTPGNVVIASVISGFAGTVSCAGGPPMALVYQRETGPRIRGTLSAVFMIGTIISIVSLWIGGQFSLPDLVLGALLVPGTLAGLALSQFAILRIDHRHTRSMVLAVSLISAIVIILRNVLMP